jgi:diaminopimelate decarboxylase
VGKLEAEIEYALQNNIGCFNVESLFELHQIQAIAKKLNKVAPIAFRVNPDIPIETHPYITTGLKENKFGVPYHEAADFYATAKKLSHIRIKGVACHLGSLIFSIEPYLLALQKLLALDIDVAHIDIGGGFGVDHKKHMEIELLSAEIKKITDKKIWVEPGRSIVAESGVLLTKVIALKSQYDKNFIIVDAGMNDFMRPCLYGAQHEIINLMPEKEIPRIYDIVGPVCETSDFFAKNVKCAAMPQDIFAIMLAGAYGFCMSSHYNSRPRCAEVLIDGEKDFLIRARETIDDLMEKERCLP